MRAIVKPWNGEWYISSSLHYQDGTYFTTHYDGKARTFVSLFGECVEIINEDEWDAEIYALLLIESEVIYE